MPILGHLGGREHLLYGVGWSGNGVGPSFVGGRILASLALGERDEWSPTRLVDRAPDPFPPEPARFLGARLVREAVIRKERSELAGRAPRRLAVRMADARARRARGQGLSRELRQDGTVQYGNPADGTVSPRP